MKKTIEEVKEWLLENRVDGDGDLDLSFLDFSDFDGDVYISDIKTKKDLCQHNQTVGGTLFQYNQTAKDRMHLQHLTELTLVNRYLNMYKHKTYKFRGEEYTKQEMKEYINELQEILGKEKD